MTFLRIAKAKKDGGSGKRLLGPNGSRVFIANEKPCLGERRVPVTAQRGYVESLTLIVGAGCLFLALIRENLLKKNSRNQWVKLLDHLVHSRET